MKIADREIRAFAFDMDGTLLDSMGFWRAENRRFLERRGLPVPEDIETTIDTMSSHAFARRFAREHGAPYTFENIVAEYEAKMAARYQTDVFPKPGAKAFLEFLRAQGIKMCVATATPQRTAMAALEKHGMLSFFEFVTDDRETPFTKAQPPFYEALAARLGEETRFCAMFEDSAYAMKAARAAGMAVFGIEENVHIGNEALMASIRENSLLFVRDFHEAMRSLSAPASERR